MTLESQNFTVDASSGLIFDILRNKIYSDPVKAIVQEIISNARDANKEAVNLQPITVICTAQKFSVKDSGLGISPDRMSNVFLQYLATSKKTDQNQTGGFGLGAKTPFAYTDSFEIITVCNGTKYQYLASIGGESSGGNVLLVTSSACTDHSGTEIVIPLQHSHHARFNTAMIKFLEKFNYPIDYTYFGLTTNYPGVVSVDSVQPSSYGVYSAIILDGINYPIDKSKLEAICYNDVLYKKYGRQKDFVLVFGSRELDVSVNRESIRHSESTNEAIRLKVNNFFFNMEEKVKNILPDLVQYDYINNQRKIPKDITQYFELMSLSDYYSSRVTGFTVSLDSGSSFVRHSAIESTNHLNSDTDFGYCEIFTLNQKADELSVSNIKKYIKSKPKLRYVFLTRIPGYPETSSSFEVKKSVDAKAKALFFKAKKYGDWKRISYNDIDKTKKSLLLKTFKHKASELEALVSTGINVLSLKDESIFDKFAKESWITTDYQSVIDSAFEKFDQQYADFLFVEKQAANRYSGRCSSYHVLDRNIAFIKKYNEKYPDVGADNLIELSNNINYPVFPQHELFKIFKRENRIPKSISCLLSYHDIDCLADNINQYLIDKIPLFPYLDFNKIRSQEHFDKIIIHL